MKVEYADEHVSISLLSGKDQTENYNPNLDRRVPFTLHLMGTLDADIVEAAESLAESFIARTFAPKPPHIPRRAPCQHEEAIIVLMTELRAFRRGAAQMSELNTRTMALFDSIFPEASDLDGDTGETDAEALLNAHVFIDGPRGLVCARCNLPFRAFAMLGSTCPGPKDSESPQPPPPP